MRRSGNKEENKRIIMDLDVVLKCHDYPYIVQCIGTFITPVSSTSYLCIAQVLYRYISQVLSIEIQVLSITLVLSIIQTFILA